MKTIAFTLKIIILVISLHVTHGYAEQASEKPSTKPTPEQLIMQTTLHPTQLPADQEAKRYAKDLTKVRESLKQDESFFSRATLSSIRNAISDQLKEILQALELGSKKIHDFIFEDTTKLEMHPEKLDPVVNDINKQRKDLNELITTTPTENVEPLEATPKKEDGTVFKSQAE